MTARGAIAILGAAGAVVAGALWIEQRRERFNVVLVTIDTLRADHLGAYGEPRGTSPAIDRLLGSGALFTEMFVPRGQTWPALASIQTSRYPVSHGVRRNGQELPDAPLTVAELLRDSGYATAAFLGNAGGAGWRGFDTTLEARGRDDEIATAAIRWIRAHAGDRFFVWIHFFGPHRPLEPEAPLVERFDPGYGGPIDGSVAQLQDISARRVPVTDRDVRRLLALYDAEVREVDRRVASVIRALQRLGLDGRTAVVLTADHGEELLDHHHYYGHSASIYDAVLRVPLGVIIPGAARGRMHRRIVEAIDLAPSIAELAGLEVPADFEGASVVSAARSGSWSEGARVAYGELEDRVVTVRTDRFRYVQNPSGFHFPLQQGGVLVPIEREELYDHLQDPGERHDIASERREVVAELDRLAERWKETHEWEAASRRYEAREAPPEARGDLTALGYTN